MARKGPKPGPLDSYPLPESEVFQESQRLVDEFYQKKFALPEFQRDEGIQEMRDYYRLGELQGDDAVTEDLRRQTQIPAFNLRKQQRIDALPELEADERDDLSLQPSLTQKILGPLERAYRSAVGEPTAPTTPDQAFPLPDITQPKRKTAEGRPILQNADGTISSELTITIDDPLNPGRYVNIPTIYNGKQLSDADARQRYIDSKGVDLETGLKLGSYETIDEAVAAAKARSQSLGDTYGQGEQPAKSRLTDDLLGVLPFGGFLQSPEAQQERADQTTLSPAPREHEELGSYQKGLGRGILHTGAQFLAGGAAVAQGLGAEETAERWMQTYDDLSQQAEEFQGVQFGEAFDSPGKFISWAAGAIGEQTPVIASILVSGGVGAVMGKVAAKGGLGRFTKVLTSDQARKVAKWSMRGAGATAGTAMTFLEGGGIYGEQREAGVEPSPGIALIGGAINGALETAVPLGIWKVLQAEKLAGPFVNDLLKKLGSMGLLARITASAGGTAVSEGLTEGLQEEVAIQARALVDEKYERLGQEAIARRQEAMATGALLGGVLGGVGGAAVPSQPQQPPPIDGQEMPPSEPSGPTPLYRLGDELPRVDLPQTTQNLGAFEGQLTQPDAVQGPPQVSPPLQEEEVIPEAIAPAIPPQPPIAVQPRGDDLPEEEQVQAHEALPPIQPTEERRPEVTVLDKPEQEDLVGPQSTKREEASLPPVGVLPDVKEEPSLETPPEIQGEPQGPTPVQAIRSRLPGDTTLDSYQPGKAAKYDWPFKAVASTSEGGYLSVDAGGESQVEAETKALERLEKKLKEREAKKPTPAPKEGSEEKRSASSQSSSELDPQIQEKLSQRDHPPKVMLPEGKTVPTQSGRTTTPFPKLDVSTPKKATNSVRRANQWLLGNAIEELEAAGDELNAKILQGEIDRKHIPPATLDEAEYFLFGSEGIRETPSQDDSLAPVLPPIHQPTPETTQPQKIPLPSVTASEQITKAAEEGRPVELEQKKENDEDEIRAANTPIKLNPESKPYVPTSSAKQVARHIAGLRELLGKDRLLSDGEKAEAIKLSEEAQTFADSESDLNPQQRANIRYNIKALQERVKREGGLKDAVGEPQDTPPTQSTELDTSKAEQFADDLKRFGVKELTAMKGVKVQPKPGSQLSKGWGGPIEGMKIDGDRLFIKTSKSGSNWFPLSEFVPATTKAPLPDVQAEKPVTPPPPVSTDRESKQKTPITYEFHNLKGEKVDELTVATEKPSSAPNAKEKEAEKSAPEPSLDAELGTIKVTVKALREDTGEEIEIEQTAKEALDDNAKELATYQKLLDCLRA